MDYQDAAFGKTVAEGTGVPSNTGSTGSTPTPAQVQALQAALNVLGFGPIATNGQQSAELTAALTRYLQTTNLTNPASPLTVDLAAYVVSVAQARAAGTDVTVSVRAAPPGIKVAGGSGARPAAQQSNTGGALPEPFYKNQKLMLGLAAAGVVAYLMWRSKGEKAAEPVKTERTDARLDGTKSKSRRTKCDRTPDVDFADGEEFTYDISEES